MSTRTSLRPVSVSGAAQACLLLLALVLICGTIVGELFSGIIVGCTLFIVWRFGVVRVGLLHHLRKGARQARAGLYTGALKSFARSTEAWEGRRWLDACRGILLGSAARWPFRDLSRYNEAWCLAQLGHAREARAALEALLRDQPQMDVADALLGSLAPPTGSVSVPDAWPALGDDPGWSDLLEEGEGEDPLNDEPTLDPRGPDLA